MANSAPVGDNVAGGKQHGLRNFIKKRLAKAGKRLHVPGAGGGPRLDRDSVDPVVRASRASKAKSRRFAREVLLIGLCYLTGTMMGVCSARQPVHGLSRCLADVPSQSLELLRHLGPTPVRLGS